MKKALLASAIFFIASQATAELNFVMPLSGLSKHISNASPAFDEQAWLDYVNNSPCISQNTGSPVNYDSMDEFSGGFFDALLCPVESSPPPATGPKEIFNRVMTFHSPQGQVANLDFLSESKYIAGLSIADQELKDIAPLLNPSKLLSQPKRIGILGGLQGAAPIWIRQGGFDLNIESFGVNLLLSDTKPDTVLDGNCEADSFGGKVTINADPLSWPVDLQTMLYSSNANPSAIFGCFDGRLDVVDANEETLIYLQLTGDFDPPKLGDVVGFTDVALFAKSTKITDLNFLSSISNPQTSTILFRELDNLKDISGIKNIAKGRVEFQGSYEFNAFPSSTSDFCQSETTELLLNGADKKNEFCSKDLR